MRNLRLFGILPLTVSALVLLPACGDDGTSPTTQDDGIDNRTLREVRDVDYVDNRFFYIDDPEAFTGPQAATIRVYRTVLPSDLVADPTIVHWPGWAVPDPDGWGLAVSGLVTPLNAGQAPANAIQHEFTLLDRGVDYSLMGDPHSPSTVIGIALNEAIPEGESRSLAVSYVSVDGWEVGGTYSELGVQPSAPDYAPDNLLLEMLKAPDPDPQGTFAATWAFEMRNVYDLGSANVDGSTLEVTVVDVLNPRAEPWFPEGSAVPYLKIFGLDQTADGRIDLGFGRVDLGAGLLFFPARNAFHPDAVDVDDWTTGEFAFTGPYAAQYDVSLAIYAEKLTPIRTEEVHQYLIRVLAEDAP